MHKTEQTNHEPAAERPRIHYGPLWDAQSQERAAGRNLVAVFVSHGMGEQVRFETISSIAEAIRKQALATGGTAEEITVHLARANDDFLARAEIRWTSGQQERYEAHVYEAYWAPLTEGQVSYWDTIRFLVEAAGNGLKWSRPLVKRTFQRFMFDGKQTLEIGGATFFGLLLALLLVLLQVLIIGFVGLEVSHRFKDLLSQPVPALSNWWAWLKPLFPGGLSPLLHPGQIGTAAWNTAVVRAVGWLALIAEAFVVRYFIIEFVGDVAAYVSPYKDSKFDELRHKIQKIGSDVASVVYGFSDQAGAVPDYHRVLVVGHSLGSVLAYDTLNAMINLDNVSPAGKRRRVIERTRALITFGSPLDKTAFIFRMQASSDQDWIREQLAAAMQPLIVSYPLYRPERFTWVNIWSPMDVISGELNFYDAADKPASDPQHIRNMQDPHARIPLYAHVQYWGNPLLRQELYRLITD